MQVKAAITTWINRFAATRVAVGFFVSLVLLMMGTSAAFAADPYYLYTGQTAAQTQIDGAPHTSTWYIKVTGSFDLGGGKFKLKTNNATQNIVMRLYQGVDTNGTLLETVQHTPSEVGNADFTEVAFNFTTVRTLTTGNYFVTLTSTTPDNKQYFIKGVDQAIISLDGTTPITPSVVTTTVSPTSAFLTSAKSASISSQLVGNTFTYTIGVGNSGGSSYTGTSTTVLDQLPAGVKVTSAVGSTGVSSVSCTNLATAGALLNCTVNLSVAINSGAPNGTAAITLNATGPSAAGALTNYTSVDADGTGSGAAKTPSATCTTADCSSVNTTFYTAALATTKTLYSVTRSGTALGSLSGYQVRSGDVQTYRITTVESSGAASGSTSVTLTETLPANTTYTGTGEGWTGSGPYTQAVSISAGQTVTKDFTVTVGTLTDGVTAISNTVAVSAGTCSSCTVSTATVPRLTISKTPPGTLATGSTAVYSVTVANTGGSVTSGTVTFQDTLPTGLTFNAQTAGASSLACTAPGQIVTCTGTPNIAAGGSVTISYRVNVAASATGTLVNAVTFTALGGDPRTPSGSAATPTAGSSTQSTDKLSAKAAQNVTTLSTTKTLSKVNGVNYAGGAIKSGDTLTYSIAVQETGGLASGTLTLTETLPANTSYTGSSEGWVLSGGSYTQNVTISASSTVTKTFTVQVGTLADGVNAITNTVAANAGSCSTCTVTTLTVPRLSISKTPPASLRAGRTETYTVVLTNNGGAATSGTVTFTDTLPAGLTFNAQTGGSASLACTVSAPTVTCTGTPNIAAGGSVTVTYTVDVAHSASGTLINAVLLTALGGDPRTPANNAATPVSGVSPRLRTSFRPRPRRPLRWAACRPPRR
ncbi:MAG: hypothetical protein RLZZ84_1727 [Pseudomonadota bacterium]